MYDEKCYELAELFLKDHPHLDNETNKDELAQVIQTAIEDFLDEIENPEADEPEDEEDKETPSPAKP